MDRICPNCGRIVDELEPHCGPDGLYCLYCTTICPNCGKEVDETDIRFGHSRTCCQYCEAELIEEEREELLDEDFEDEDEDDSCGFGNITKENLEQKMRKQEQKLKDAKAKLRKSNIEFLKATAKANGEPVPENLESLSDEELNAKVEPLMKKFLKTYFSNQN